jgi:hypothetical protein
MYDYHDPSFATVMQEVAEALDRPAASAPPPAAMAASQAASSAGSGGGSGGGFFGWVNRTLTGVVDAVSEFTAAAGDTISSTYNQVADEIDRVTMGHDGPLGNLVAGAGGFVSSLVRSQGEIAGGFVDFPGSIGAMYDDVQTSITIGREQGIAAGAAHFTGVQHFAEAYVLVVDEGRSIWDPEVNAKLSEGSARLGATFGTAAGVAGRISGVRSANSSFAYGTKIQRQIPKRGWSDALIDETISSPHHVSPALNKATNNPATAYFRKDGSYVVRENASGRIIQVSDRFKPNWVPDATIQNPYKP